MTNISKILIANRGEIASRIIRSAHESNLLTVAIYTDADKNSPYVREASESIRIDSSYLDSHSIIKAAKQTNADAVHPGYGFLSENHEFANLVNKEKLIWIGPSPEAVRIMGDKIEAKKYAKKAGVPILPSGKTEKSIKDINYPLLIKAAAGGGGKGMRIVENELELKKSIKLAKLEAKTAFGDDRIFIERYVKSARHIEVQILGDQFGNIIHLGERECSIQRRHQKIIEEAPSLRLSKHLREQLTDAAVALAQQINYESAGTIEFLFDDQSNDFWFLEMNTRLQVEHPVTEMVTGIDIVSEQIKIAQGKELSINQDDIQTEGHSIEARIYAEDPDNDFLPSTGKLIADNHTNKDDIRWDTGVEEGIEIGTDFDPMLAKVITYGSTRGQAIDKLCRELQSVHFGGFNNNIEFLINILRDKNFIAGKTTTDFIELNQPKGHISLDEKEQLYIGITASLWLQGLNRYSATVQKHIPSGWHNARLPNQRTLFVMGGKELEVQYKRQRDGSFKTSSDNKVIIHDWQTNSIDIEIDGLRHQSNISMNNNMLLVQHPKGSKILTILPRFKSSDSKLVKGSLVSPMPGKVIEIKIKQGQAVLKGDELVVIEAMKMNHTISADHDGVVKKIFIKVGNQLDLGENLLTLSENKSK